MIGRLHFKEYSSLQGKIFGFPEPVSGELVFNTGMVGYVETMTDPSYTGQIIVFSYPLIGNYGIPDNTLENNLYKNFESQKIYLKGIIITSLSPHYNHWKAHTSLEAWMHKHKIVGLQGIDTRYLTQYIRDNGSQLATISVGDKNTDFVDPNEKNLVAQVSSQEVIHYPAGEKTVLFLDMGTKTNIIRSLLDRNVSVKRVPWDYDYSNEKFDGILISNGPGDPIQVSPTIEKIKKQFVSSKPIMGICLGHQILGLAAGALTYKMKFGHRSQNQPVVDVHTKKCYITSQNHGYSLDGSTLPHEWQEWFINGNDGTNEGIYHKSKPFFSVQFHPEAKPGPTDSNFLFDKFVKLLFQ